MERRTGWKSSVIAAVVAVIGAAASAVPTSAQAADWYEIRSYYPFERLCWDNYALTGYVWQYPCGSERNQAWTWDATPTTWIMSNQRVAGKRMCLQVSGTAFYTPVTMMECDRPTGYHTWRWRNWGDNLWVLELWYEGSNSAPRCVGASSGETTSALVLSSCVGRNSEIWKHFYRFSE